MKSQQVDILCIHCAPPVNSLFTVCQHHVHAYIYVYMLCFLVSIVHTVVAYIIITRRNIVKKIKKILMRSLFVGDRYHNAYIFLIVSQFK